MDTKIPIEELLFEEEGTTLDFKRNQYPISDKNDFVKSEIIKDILAFSNAWRRSDAYILLGVEEVKGGRSKPVGIEFELDDAQLQQFVNSKTQKPISFTYKTITVDGVKLGVIKIPKQVRPFYLIKDYGNVKKKVVYVRRGSSTDIADPEEILNMGVAQAKEVNETPNLNLDFADLKSRTKLGSSLNLVSTLLDIPKKIPDYSDSRSFDKFNFYTGSVNHDFYRKLSIYYYAINKFRELAFSITNNSQTTANDVKIDIHVEKTQNKIYFIQKDDIPHRPKTHHHVHPNIDPFAAQRKKPDITIQNLGDAYRIEVLFEKVQPMQTVFTKDIVLIGCNETLCLALKAKIYADNIPYPIEANLNVSCNVEVLPVTLDDIVEMNNNDEMKRFLK